MLLLSACSLIISDICVVDLLKFVFSSTEQELFKVFKALLHTFLASGSLITSTANSKDVFNLV